MARVTRDDALATLKEGRAVIDDLLARMTDAQAEVPGTIGGGDWSAKDLLGHLAFWEELAVDAAAQWRTGGIPRAEAIFGGNTVDAANAEDQQRTAARSMAEVRERAAAAHRTITSVIDQISDEEWESLAPYETSRRRRLGEMLGSIMGMEKRPFGHAFAHEPDLRAAVERAEASP